MAKDNLKIILIFISLRLNTRSIAWDVISQPVAKQIWLSRLFKVLLNIYMYNTGTKETKQSVRVNERVAIKTYFQAIP